MAKDFRSIRKEAERQGWTIELTGGNHWKFIPPDPAKKIVHTSSTPSDHRTLDNFISRLRKSGFIWPPPRKGK